MIQFERKTCGDLEAALRREWLETNGLGGFAANETYSRSALTRQPMYECTN